mmetsp:Transcript_108823/g.249658  ORF Transcript_108823/g.249658 Transcript_108823/m.249658 type:complete len:633 (-) Transcript_108823:114-2012(-)
MACCGGGHGHSHGHAHGEAPPVQAISDPSSRANLKCVRQTHCDLKWTVDFDTKTIRGSAAITFACHKECEFIVLDTRDISIKKITDEKGENMTFNMGGKSEALGSALHIALNDTLNDGEKLTITMEYETSTTCSAIQFLEPAQTAGKQHPYLFSQCQAIHARALVPCQDSPGAKMTYYASVTVPKPLTALMSAVARNDGQATAAEGDTQTFEFDQKVPIPSYLIAIAAGELESRQVGPRSKVWSEPCMVEAGAYEFANTEDFIQAAEGLVGPYVWGRYDMLLLPPSFPYGGMENPCLTFLTPTLLAGDRSLVDVVAHEISHSWTGNLVTNATWEHFWLNEGFTMFLERKILSKLHGPAMFEFGAAEGDVDLKDELKTFGAENVLTKLVPTLDGIDPDDAFSTVPYEKGFYFLYYLQSCAGGAEAFDPFLKKYIEKFAYGIVTSHQLKTMYNEEFGSLPAVQEIQWDDWLYGVGAPPPVNTYNDTMGQAARDLAEKWDQTDLADFGSASDMEGWVTRLKIYFLSYLVELRSAKPMSQGVASRLGEVYQFSESKNAEICFHYYKLAFRAGVPGTMEKVCAFVTQQGRMKYVRPLYKMLAEEGQESKAVAVKCFQEHRAGYHPICAKMVAQDLEL